MAEKWKILLKGIIKENPVLVLVLGTCPTLAMTTSLSNAVGMGLSVLFVLVCSNIVISALRRLIPDQVRIPAYIVVIACFVTVVKMLLQAFVPALFASLGTFLDLIVVNCIILGRAEMFASKNTVADSALDGVGMGIGFTLALVVMATIREVFGSGTFFGLAVPVLENYHFSILTQPTGGFFIFGCVMALTIKLTAGKAPIRKNFGCEGCPSAAVCHRDTCSGDAGKEANG